MTRRAVCPGSFDPVTNGHLDIIERACDLFDEVVVAVLHNPAKLGHFGVPERVGYLEEAVGAGPHAAQITILSFSDRLLVDVCREVSATAIVKGLRGPEDYSYELPMARMNSHLSGVETVFLPADPAWTHVSSSLIREIAARGASVDGLVPDGVRAALTDEIGTGARLE